MLSRHIQPQSLFINDIMGGVYHHGKEAQDEGARQLGYGIMGAAGVPMPFGLMNLAEAPVAAAVTPQEDFSFKDLKNSISKGFNKAKKAVGISKLDAKANPKTLDQLVNDYGMEFDYSNIESGPIGGYYAAAPLAFGAYGDYPYGPNPWDGDFYGAYAAPAAFIY